MIFLLFFTFIFSVIQTEDNFHLVETLYGDVSCSTNPTTNVSSCYGIPYANTPERLVKATIKTPWPKPERTSGLRGAKCMQKREIAAAGNIEISEDCLFLDIMYPPIDQNNLHPVVVYVHGGGFTSGHVKQESLEFLAEEYASKGIVVVTIQYRLGLFGFLSNGCSSTIFSCNLGLYDQYIAFTFIKDVIRSFGGDNTKMTLWGHSAGSIATSIHSASPKTSPFFNNYIEMSAASYGLEMVVAILKPVDVSTKILNFLGCVDERKYVECFKNADIEKILTATPDLLLPDIGDDFMSVDRAFKKSHNVLIGLESLESLYFVLKSVPLEQLEYLTFTQCAQILQQALNIIIPNAESYVSRMAKVHHMTPAHVTVFLLSALQFDGAVRGELTQRVELGSNVYAFHHSYYNPTIFNLPLSFRGSFHTSVLPYAINEFTQPFVFEFNSQDMQVRKFFVDTIVNFIKTGNASTSFYFPPATTEGRHVKVNLKPIVVENNFFDEQFQVLQNFLSSMSSGQG